MLLMQALACEVARAFTKLGMAMAAKRPIMATTIMISTNVKPALRMVLVFFIFYFSFLLMRRERGHRRVTMITTLFTNCLWQPHLIFRIAAVSYTHLRA